MDGETIPEWAHDLPPYDPSLLDDLEPPPTPKRARIEPESPVLRSESSGQFSTAETQILYNIKINLDPSWTKEDYIKIVDRVFTDSPKVLVVTEKMGGGNRNPHAHLQGYSPYKQSTLVEYLRKIVKPMHFQMKPGVAYAPKSRPISTAVADEVGFQYCVKEAPNAVAPLYQRGFTPEELMELHEKSQAHVKKLKFNIREFIQTLKWPAGSDSQAVYDNVLCRVGQKLYEEGKDITRYTKLDVKNGILHHPDCTPKMRGALIKLN